MSKSRYGFIDLREIDQKKIVREKDIPIKQKIFATTDLFEGHAKNHCAATLVTNLCLYYWSLDERYKPLLELDDRGQVDLQKTFAAVHKFVGDGPVLFLRKKALAYFKSRGFTLEGRILHTKKALKEAVERKDPCAILLENAYNDYHWVLSTGYKESSFGDLYLNVIDNWYASHDRFINYGLGHVFLYAVEFKIL